MPSGFRGNERIDCVLLLILETSSDLAEAERWRWTVADVDDGEGDEGGSGTKVFIRKELGGTAKRVRTDGGSGDETSGFDAERVDRNISLPRLSGSSLRPISRLALLIGIQKGLHCPRPERAAAM